MTANKTKPRMTCQCCGRAILAETGMIAHHGYERPGDGWQTGSCMGARELPFEVSRRQLGLLIASIHRRIEGMIEGRIAIADETAPIKLTHRNTFASKDKSETTLEFTRANFEETRKLRPSFNPLYVYSFDALKEQELKSRDRAIENVTKYRDEQQARFDGWKETHKRQNDEWVLI